MQEQHQTSDSQPAIKLGAPYVDALSPELFESPMDYDSFAVEHSESPSNSIATLSPQGDIAHLAFRNGERVQNFSKASTRSAQCRRLCSTVLNLKSSVLHARIRKSPKSAGWERAPGFDLDDAFEETTADCKTDNGEEIVDLVQNCYTLVAVSGHWLCMAPILFISVAQIVVLYIMTWRSPEYLFAQGTWVTPLSSNLPLDVTKIFSLLLVLFQVAAEFEEAGYLFRVLAHKPKVENVRSCARAIFAMHLQYMVALLVLIVAVHMVLSCQRAIEPLWKTWYVFMTLNFDNMLCKFLLFALDLSSKLHFVLCAPHLRDDRLFNMRAQRVQRYLFVWMPAIAIFIVTTFSLAWNICPLTFLRYGYVTNDFPVVMITSDMGLPSGCCPIYAKEVTNVSVSAPCLSPVDGGLEISVFWVVWSSTKDPPSSLQIVECRGGDGTQAWVCGHSSAYPQQMRHWLLAHNYSKHVYDSMVSQESSFGLLRTRFAYAAEWIIQDFPWGEQSKIFAVAMNRRTGALSPKPISSHVLSSSLESCPSGCAHCGSKKLCYVCKSGYSFDKHRVCQPCASHCESCQHHGAGHCDNNQCHVGYGLLNNVCLPCSSEHCMICDHSEHDGHWAKKSLPCSRCVAGFGLLDGACVACGIDNCQECSSQGTCDECAKGFSLTLNGSFTGCHACADHCADCSKLGAGSCDPMQCSLGFGGTPDGKCSACSRNCLSCHHNGGGSCDPDQCGLGFGLQGNLQAPLAVCKECKDNCGKCDDDPDRCESCLEGYGLTPEGKCEACEMNCKRCNQVAGCDECIVGFFLKDRACLPCADQCEVCKVTGPGLCDERQCIKGWTTVSASGGFYCRPCADPRCTTCDLNGPEGECDDWSL